MIFSAFLTNINISWEKQTFENNSKMCRYMKEKKVKSVYSFDFLL